MSGDNKDQPNIFYSKEFTESKENLLMQGKVKSVYQMAGEPQKVYVHFHDKVTAGNGKKVDYPDGKGKVCCLISALLFEYMEKNNVKTHYLGTEGLDTLLCRKLEIIPIEIIVRNIAAGSIVKQTTISDGTIISPPIVEYFLKDDAKDDPLLTEDRIKLMGYGDEIPALQHHAREINAILKGVFRKIGLTLVDFKLEFGYDVDKNLLLADELSPDGMRLWKEGTKESFDKDLFRKGKGDIVEAYTHILEKLKNE